MRTWMVGLVMFSPVAALAGSATAALTVTATVTGSCTITTTPVTFASYDPVVANATNPLDSVGAVVIACTKGISAPVGLDLGANGTGSTRRMAAGGTYLTYELYQDSAHTTVWGNSGSSRVTPAAAPSRLPQSISVYARIAGGQDVGAGTYTDTVTATVNF